MRNQIAYLYGAVTFLCLTQTMLVSWERIFRDQQTSQISVLEKALVDEMAVKLWPTVIHHICEVRLTVVKISTHAYL